MSSDWIVPTASCTATNTGSFVELGNFDTNQKEVTAAGVNINCIEGNAQYQAYTWQNVSGKVETDYPEKVKPGDKIGLAISATTTARVASVANLTRGWAKTWTVTSGRTADLIGGQMGLEPVSVPQGATPPPLTKVSDVVVAATSASGKSIAAQEYAIDDMTSSDKKTYRAVVTNELLTPSGGFTVHWMSY